MGEVANLRREKKGNSVIIKITSQHWLHLRRNHIIHLHPVCVFDNSLL